MHRILVAHDGSEHADRAAALVADMPWAMGSVVHLVAVVPEIHETAGLAALAHMRPTRSLGGTDSAQDTPAAPTHAAAPTRTASYRDMAAQFGGTGIAHEAARPRRPRCRGRSRTGTIRTRGSVRLWTSHRAPCS